MTSARARPRPPPAGIRASAGRGSCAVPPEQTAYRFVKTAPVHARRELYQDEQREDRTERDREPTSGSSPTANTCIVPSAPWQEYLGSSSCTRFLASWGRKSGCSERVPSALPRRDCNPTRMYAPSVARLRRQGWARRARLSAW